MNNHTTKMGKNKARMNHDHRRTCKLLVSFFILAKYNSAAAAA